MTSPANPRAARVGLVLAMLYTVVPAWLYRDWWVDDAAISFSYARNLIHGDGLVPFAGGERAEAFSNPLWVLVLALGQVVHLDPFPLSKGLGLLLSMATVPVAWLFARRLPVPERWRESAWVPLVAALLVATNAQQGIWAACGLENALLSFLLACGLWRFLVEWEEGGAPWSALFFVGVAFTRPEGLIYGAVVGACGVVWEWRRGRLRRAVVWCVAFAVPVVAYQIARYAYFALPLPLPFYAKVDAQDFSVLSWRARGWKYTSNWGREVGWSVVSPVLLAGAARLGGWRWRVGALVATVMAA